VRVVINQSNYLPWKGYFDLIHDADIFIFLDDVQYTQRDWRSRNRIKTKDGPLWLTIPVGNATDRLINEVPLPSGGWANQHWQSIRHAYAACPHFEAYAPFFADVFARCQNMTLSAFNQFLITTIARDYLGLTNTKFLDSAAFAVQAKKQERILALLKAVGATTYISGPAAKEYLNPDRLAAEGIALQWKDYSGYPEYRQPHPPFEHAVSIVDLLFSAGPAAPDFIWGWRGTSADQAPAP
jgi:hypothetical protein